MSIDINNLPSNSYKSREMTAKQEERKVDKLVSGKTKTKKNDMRKLTDIFIAEDAQNVKSYIFMDVLVPAIKKAISDIVTDGIAMILYGTSGGNRHGKSSSHVSYRSYYDDRRGNRDRDRFETRRRFDYDDILYETRGEAELVLDGMIELIERYGFVTVADMYDMSDQTAPYTANKYGWNNVSSAKAVHVGDGYILKLPKAMLID